MSRRSDMLEGVAVVAAVACLVHCIGLPLVFAVLPAVASVMPVPTYFHLIALLLAIPATGGALLMGYRRHRLATPLVTGFAGLVLLALGAILWGETPLEVPVTVLGSLVIAGAHLTNWRLRRSALHPLA